MSAVGEQQNELSPVTKLHIEKAVDVLVDEFGHHQLRETIQRIMDDSVRQFAGGACATTSTIACRRSSPSSKAWRSR